MFSCKCTLLKWSNKGLYTKLTVLFINFFYKLIQNRKKVFPVYLFYFTLLNINNTDNLVIFRIINTFATLILKAMKIDITRHTHLTILFILFLSICRTTLAQEANSDSIVISYLQESGIPITQNNRLKLLKSGHTKFIDLFEK